MKLKATIELEYEVDGTTNATQLGEIVLAHVAKLDGVFTSEEYDTTDDWALVLNSYAVLSTQQEN